MAAEFENSVPCACPAFGISVNRWQPENVLHAIETDLVDTVQVVHNVFDQEPEDVLFGVCARKGIGVIARVPPSARRSATSGCSARSDVS